MEFGMNHQNLSGRLLRQGGDVESRGRRSACTRRTRSRDTHTCRDRDDTPSVGSLESIFGVFVILITDVNIVGGGRAERVVVPDLTALAIETVVVMRERTESNGAAASRLAGNAG